MFLKFKFKVSLRRKNLRFARFLVARKNLFLIFNSASTIKQQKTKRLFEVISLLQTLNGHAVWHNTSAIIEAKCLSVVEFRPR